MNDNKKQFMAKAAEKILELQNRKLDLEHSSQLMLNERDLVDIEIKVIKQSIQERQQCESCET